MPDIPQWKKDRCKRCAAGDIPYAGRNHLDENRMLLGPICTAPTESEYITELEARLKESAEDTADLTWIRKRVKSLGIASDDREPDSWMTGRKFLTEVRAARRKENPNE